MQRAVGSKVRVKRSESPRSWLGRRVGAAALAVAGFAVAGACGAAMESPFGMSATTRPDGPLAATSTTVPDSPQAGDDGVAGNPTGTEAPAGDGTTTPPTAGDTTSTTLPSAPLQGLALELIASELQQPTGVTAPVGDDRLFVIERVGVVRMIDAAGSVGEDPFLDLRDRVRANGIEQGLLGFAFHPGYAGNGRMFAYYTDSGGRRQLSEFRVSDDEPNRAERDSEKVLFELEQPPDATDIRHYAGAINFGPDGYLYVSLGDGADARGQGQNPDSFFAAIVRLDVDGGEPYAVPAENPFVVGGGAPEVWAYGLRNPWRFSIDHVERLLYVADVGQSAWEEVNVVSIDTGGGANFGWITTEGNHCFSPSDCDMTGITLPVLEYSHDDGCSVTGGFVYRGSAIPEIAGHYFYSDWCGQWVRSFRYADGVATEEQDWSDQLSAAGQVNTFGLDGSGEMYLANFAGELYKIVPVR